MEKDVEYPAPDFIFEEDGELIRGRLEFCIVRPFAPPSVEHYLAHRQYH